MFGRKIVIMFIVLMVGPYLYSATSANDYLDSGRSYLFDGSISGIRQANAIFDQGIHDLNCMDCAQSQELLFFHAISRIGMWVVREDGGSIDSGMELAKQYGTQVLGDFIRDIAIIEPDVPKNRYDSYDIPSEIESNILELLRFMDTVAISEIDEIVAELDMIQDRPGNPFRVYLSPSETQVFMDPNLPPLSYDIEVDYAEVNLLKGLLLVAKSLMQAKSAYDLNINEEGRLLEKFYGDCLSINQDVLLPHPDLLKILPTVNDPNNGKEILAQARVNLINGLQYYVDTINYILSEDNPSGSDPQGDELLSLDPNNLHAVREVVSATERLIGSLTGDTKVTMTYQTSKIFILKSPEIDVIGQLSLTFDSIGQPKQDGVINFNSGVIDSSRWIISDFLIEQNLIFIQMENLTNGFVSGYLSGTINQDRTQITNATLDYWGDMSGTINMITGDLLSLNKEEYVGDLNPIFGSSYRYPNPVAPRNMLPEFDALNSPLPDSVGNGIGFDATLGGIIPGMTQDDWNIIGNLQPDGYRIWQELESWQKLNGWVGFWLPEQLVFEDMLGEVSEDYVEVSGVDIAELYLGYDADYIQGCISLIDSPSYGRHCYQLTWSYSSREPSDLNALRVMIYLQDGQDQDTQLLYNISSDGYSYWDNMGSFDVQVYSNLIFFRIPLEMIPCYLSGRYVSLESFWGWDEWFLESIDKNDTHIQMNFNENLNRITGTVSYDGYIGAPIYVQAYTDPLDIENSIVASTMILQPGAFTLDGMGYGWSGYIRAFTPLFGFDVFDMDAISIQASKSVIQYQNIVAGVNLVLQNPIILEKDVWVSGAINTTTNLEDVFAFDAIHGGTYTIDLSRPSESSIKMSLTGRNGTEQLVESYGDSTHTISWWCPEDGRYYVRVSDYEWQLLGGSYQIRLTSNVDCPLADISGIEWKGVKDCRVDLSDFILFASHWLDICSKPYWCEESDYDKDRGIDTADLMFLVNQWLDQGEVGI